MLTGPVRRWWSRTRDLDPAAHETWRATLVEVPGSPARILTWAESASGELVVLSPAVLSVFGAGEWRHVGWQEIERGGWNGETEQLRWQTYAGRRGAVALPDPARVPAVFKERVDASLVFERFYPLVPESDRGVVVSGRRSLGDTPTEIAWHTTLTRGVTWRTPGVRALADAVLAGVRHEYDEH